MKEDVLLEKEAFYRKLDRLLNVAAGSVRGAQELKDIESWDSLAILEFIVLADDDYKSTLEPTDITNCETVEELAKLTFTHSALAHERLHTGD